MAAPTFEQLIGLIDEQQARIERLEAAAAPRPEEPGASTDGEGAVVSRRGMITGAAVGAAGVVGAILATPGVAAATGRGTFSSTTTAPAVRGTNLGKGQGVLGDANAGVGVAGISKHSIGVTGSSASVAAEAAAIKGAITSKSPGGFSAGVRGVNHGTADLGIGVYGSASHRAAPGSSGKAPPAMA